MIFIYPSVTKKYDKSSTTSMKKAITTFTFILFLFSILSTPRGTIHAGLFSFITEGGADQASAKSVESTNKQNSQNMILLEAAVNTDPNPYKDLGTSVIAYGNALSPEIGPQGTVSDIKNKVTGNISLYTVREGDTISEIADMFDVSINTILWANDLSSKSSIKEGQLLLILPISGIKHTVKRGDTIKSISTKYKVDINEILDDNDITLLTKLSPGDVIVIPNAETAFIAPKIAIKKSGESNTAHNTDGPFYPGYYDRPIDDGRKSQGLHGYNAVDLAAPIGTPIRAAAAGKVISSISNGKWNGGYGNFVIISHDNGTQTLYAHNQKNFVSVGDSVEKGTLIAKIGMTGQTTGPHVHFEIRGAKNPF
jgi:murein DD-endopeptidase MepM/ murein hydrolase activator NlpD